MSVLLIVTLSALLAWLVTAHEVKQWVDLDKMSPGCFTTEPKIKEKNIKDVLSWTKCLHGHFGQDQMSANHLTTRA